jgi:hypothetical protein
MTSRSLIDCFWPASVFFCWLFYPVLPTEAFSVLQSRVDVSVGGITALFHIPATSEIIAGTKKGSLYTVNIGVDGSSLGMINLTFHEFPSLEAGKARKGAYPIYCIDANQNGSILFCGGGDRSVSVWERRHPWVKSQTLGPHTGWVKGLVFNRHDQLLHSIGCNCIETWTASNKSSDEYYHWSHWKKSTIKSSPTEGCTLSSDLLCLCLVGPSPQYVAAGGVDGRIHFWASSIMGQPRVSFAAHSGRVNALVYAPDNHALLSASSDGYLKCWDCLDFSTASSPMLQLDFGSNVRITALSYGMHLGKPMAMVGTQTGEVSLVALPALGSDETLRIVERIQLKGSPVVYAHCMLPNQTSRDACSVLVGHSQGLCYIEFNTLK